MDARWHAAGAPDPIAAAGRFPPPNARLARESARARALERERSRTPWRALRAAPGGRARTSASFCAARASTAPPTMTTPVTASS
eukprot:188191-Pyramimonas_sp.AAC.1